MSEQLWDYQRIMNEMYPLLSEVNDPNISDQEAYMLHPTLALKLVNQIRDDYERRIAELTAEVERLRAAETWEPVEDGAYNVPDGVVEISRGTVQLWHEKSRKYQRAITLKHGWAIFKRKEVQGD